MLSLGGVVSPLHFAFLLRMRPVPPLPPGRFPRPFHDIHATYAPNPIHVLCYSVLYADGRSRVSVSPCLFHGSVGDSLLASCTVGDTIHTNTYTRSRA